MGLQKCIPKTILFDTFFSGVQIPVFCDVFKGEHIVDGSELLRSPVEVGSLAN